MVWTDQLVAEFLDYAETEAPDLHPLLHFMAYRGPRRGEARGLLDAEVRLDKAEVSIVNQIAVTGGATRHKKPESESGNRDVVLNPDTGLFFVRRDGRAWHPCSVSQRFRRLIQRGDFPPARLHDLRHSAATIALQAGVDVKVVSEQLGHSTTTLTVLNEAATAEDLTRWLNAETLRRVWPSLWLPVRRRALWQARFPELAAPPQAVAS
ncbi:site-specific integrase [Actinoplanes sp. NPDC049599]|uniref:site-specific integrase n=1 Tax=Actinoplanes sp. NPDC049599 TaxID=3363903 RepID=UPI0037B26637